MILKKFTVFHDVPYNILIFFAPEKPKETCQRTFLRTLFTCQELPIHFVVNNYTVMPRSCGGYNLVTTLVPDSIGKR